jgi:hypothetical protein
MLLSMSAAWKVGRRQQGHQGQRCYQQKSIAHASAAADADADAVAS